MGEGRQIQHCVTLIIAHSTVHLQHFHTSIHSHQIGNNMNGYIVIVLRYVWMMHQFINIYISLFLIVITIEGQLVSHLESTREIHSLERGHVCL